MKFILKKILLWVLKFLRLKDQNSSWERLTKDKSKSGTNIEMLPNEIMSRVFKYLKGSDMIQCFNTSQKWRDLAKSSIYQVINLGSLNLTCSLNKRQTIRTVARKVLMSPIAHVGLPQAQFGQKYS